MFLYATFMKSIYIFGYPIKNSTSSIIPFNCQNFYLTIKLSFLPNFLRNFNQLHFLLEIPYNFINSSHPN